MHIVSRLKLPFKTEKKKLLFNLPVAQRLTLGFLLAALIAGLLAGGTALIRIQSLHQQSDFYQRLLQAKTTLASGNDLLKLMDIQMHEVLTLANDQPVLSVETLQDDEKDLSNLITSYDTLLNNYVRHDLLKDNPEQISLLSEAHQDALVTSQTSFANSAERTWGSFRNVLLKILNETPSGDNKPSDITDAIKQEHLLGEPLFSDAQSAMLALLRFNDNLANSARDAVSVEESNQIMITVIGVILAIISIALIGLFISSTVVHRLKQLRQVTKAVEQGEVRGRIRVIGSDEIADISTSVNAMLEIIASEQKIKIASDLKDQFIAGISHELRNPLTNVFGWLEILIDYHEELDKETQMRFLRRAMYGCQELIQIVNNVLDATRVGRGMSTVQLTTVPLNALVQSVLDNTSPHITENYHIKTVMEEEFVALADPQYVRQVLQNLLSNAFKYSPKQSTVTIRVNRLSHQSADGSSIETNDLCICVEDTGPGIPPEERPNLFQKFARLQRDQNVRGTGLGLYLSKQLVESMGGCIWVESTGIVGEGSSFFFTLPLPSPVVDIPRPPYIPTPEVPV